MLEVADLGKSYRIYPSQRARLHELVTGRRTHEESWALRDVSFALKAGDALGVIGDNGAGKSTLLKLIAGTLRPTTGSVRLQGRLTAILELGTGFHPDFSGRDNLFFAGALMGVERAELLDYFDEIVAFSELADVIDRPVKTYSTGMVVRLAFSLVTAVSPQILIIDEALAVGDRAFQRKCIDRMMQIRDSGATILFCSHSMHHVMQFCDRALWLEQGGVKALGEAAAVVDQYIGKDVPDQIGGAAAPRPRPEGRRRCLVESLELVSPGPSVRRGEPITVSMGFRVVEAGEFVLGAAVDHRQSAVRLAAETSLENGIPPVFIPEGTYQVQLRIHSDWLRQGRYSVFAGLMGANLMQTEDYRSLDLDVVDPDNVRTPAMVRARVDWDTESVLLRSPGSADVISI